MLGACSLMPLETGERTGGDKSGDYASLMRVAAAMRQANDLNGAVGVYRNVSSHAPNKPEPLIELGATLMDLGRYNEASTSYEAALNLQPKNPEALVGQARALLQSDRPQLAIPPLERELKIHPDDIKALTALGIAQDLTGNHPLAQETYRSGLQLSPGNAALTGDLALSLAIESRTDEALQLLKPIATLPDATPRMRQNLALVYGLAGDRDAAARMARLDLDETAVQHNLAYFETLRTLPPAARTRAIMAVPAAAPLMTPATSPDLERR
jgi:Flp pilus assembly protein TadD